MLDPHSNVIAIRKAAGPLAFAPGVVPFDRNDPDHIRVWNAIFAFASRETARHCREGRHA